MFIDAEAETPILWPCHVKCWLIWKDPKRLRARGEGDDRGWDGWLASLTQWTWVWVGSESWWWTRRPGALQFMGSQRVGHDWVTELNWDYSTNSLQSLLSLTLYYWNLLKYPPLGHLCSPVVKKPPTNAGDTGSIPGQGTKIPHVVGQVSPCAATREACIAKTKKPLFQQC